MENEVKLKKCTKCSEEKEETTEFYYWNKTFSRYENTCKICLIEQNKINRERKRMVALAGENEPRYSEDGVKLKKCTECAEEKKETIEFFPFRTKRNEFGVRCRACVNKENGDRRKRKAKEILDEINFLGENYRKICGKCKKSKQQDEYQPSRLLE